MAVATADEPSIEPLALRNGVCEAGEFCVYRDSNRSGPVIDWTTGGDDNTYTNNTWPIVGGNVNDKGSSVWNRSNCAVRIFRDSYQNGTGYTVQVGEVKNLGSTPVGNDEASSHNACP